jgi:hypothetical protein
MDGTWSEPVIKDDSNSTLKATLHSKLIPHMYFFVVMDCTNNFQRTYKNIESPVPKVLTEISMKNVIGGEATHFSYENIGVL